MVPWFGPSQRPACLIGTSRTIPVPPRPARCALRSARDCALHGLLIDIGHPQVQPRSGDLAGDQPLEIGLAAWVLERDLDLPAVEALVGEQLLHRRAVRRLQRFAARLVEHLGLGRAAFDQALARVVVAAVGHEGPRPLEARGFAREEPAQNSHDVSDGARRGLFAARGSVEPTGLELELERAPLVLTEPTDPLPAAHGSTVGAVRVKNRIAVTSGHRCADRPGIQAGQGLPAARSLFLWTLGDDLTAPPVHSAPAIAAAAPRPRRSLPNNDVTPRYLVRLSLPLRGLLSKRIRRLTAPSILAWFQDKITEARTSLTPESTADADFGGTVHGFGSLFEAAKKDSLHTPKTTAALAKLLREHLHIEGGPENIRVDEHSLRVFTNDGQVELAYFFFDDEALKKHPGYLTYLLHEGVNLPRRRRRGAVQAAVRGPRHHAGRRGRGRDVRLPPHVPRREIDPGRRGDDPGRAPPRPRRAPPQGRP